MRRLFGFLATIALVVVVAATHDVSHRLDGRDVNAARILLADAADAGSRPLNFAGQVQLVQTVQDSVLRAAPVNEEIPQGERRELSDLVRAGHGLCFDRSRAIETLLRFKGLQTRHVAIYSTKAHSTLAALATPGVESHAVTEVQTARGWMIVDSNSRWIGLTSDGQPVSTIDLRHDTGRKWHGSVKSAVPAIFREPFTWVYGLYSRHGRFFPPYNPIPDVHWGEFIQNL